MTNLEIIDLEKWFKKEDKSEVIPVDEDCKFVTLYVNDKPFVKSYIKNEEE